MDCIIHIGTGKTGTTSIQNVLARRRAVLQRAGILYPETLGRTNHEAAAVCAAEFEPGFTPRKAPGVGDAAALEVFRLDLHRRLQEEIRQSGCSKLILSNEHLFEKVRTPEQAARIRDLIGLPPGQVRIVLYIRPQPAMAAATYAELLRMGSTPPSYDKFLKTRRTEALLDYAGGLDAWAAVFGDAAITLRVFERARLTGGDVVADFAEIAGIDPALVAPGPDIDDVTTSRQSFDAAAVAFLKRFNAEVTQLLNARGDKAALDAFRVVRHRARIARCIEDLNHPGPGFAFDAETVAQIRHQHEAANAAMFARFGVAPFTPAAVPPGGDDPAAALDTDHAFALFARMWAEIALNPGQHRNETPARTERSEPVSRSTGGTH